MKNKDAIRRRLEMRREMLMPRWRARLDEESRLLDHKEPDLTDLSAEQQEAARLDQLSEVELGRMQEVADALERLEIGTYGMCVRCGEAIDERRLEVVPEAAVCRDCREDVEEDEARGTAP